MAINRTNPYDIDAHIAEVYDLIENGTEECGFTILEQLGDYHGETYTTKSRRVIIWAQRNGRKQ